MERQRVNYDLISQLPEILKNRILDLLPPTEACRTSVLSKQWKFTWASLPRLKFVMTRCLSSAEFHDYVDRILALRRTSGLPIRQFYLGLMESCESDRVCSAIAAALRQDVKDLELCFPPERFAMRFMWGMFSTCTTLVELTLRGKLVLDMSSLPPGLVNFPALKILKLIQVSYRDEKTLKILFEGLPALQELFVERNIRNEDDNNLSCFTVKSQTLIKLRTNFKLYVDRRCKLVIKAPNLQQIHLSDHHSKEIFVANGLRFVEAYISISAQVPSVVKILKGVSQVATLTLTTETLNCLLEKIKREGNNLDMPDFPNLKKLVIQKCNWDVVNFLLACMPNVEEVTFCEGLVSGRLKGWNPPMPHLVPRCLTLSVRSINILKGIDAQELPFLRYLLQNALALETMTITNTIEESVSAEVISELPRGSFMSEVVIHA